VVTWLEHRGAPQGPEPSTTSQVYSVSPGHGAAEQGVVLGFGSFIVFPFSIPPGVPGRLLGKPLGQSTWCR